jgi:beta-galactosidase/beta-glucuronidase
MEHSGLKYPRKQLRRKHWLSLDGEWQFAFDDRGVCSHPSEVTDWPSTILVPFPPESEASGVKNTDFHYRCWYKRKFHYDKPQSGRTLLHFGAVDYEARIWLNGQFLGQHTGGHTPFFFDATHALKEGGEQEVVVCADDDPHDLAKPRGKQDWQREPHSIWYPRTSGIWQTVWLEDVPIYSIDRVSWTPLLERWEIGCEVFFSGVEAPHHKLRVTLSVGDRILAEDTYTLINREVHRRIALSDPGIEDFRNELLWSPERPTLIAARLELLGEKGEVVDEVLSYTALRSVAVQRGRFLLNGRPYYMRLVLDQGYWRESLMTPPDEHALRKDIELIKAAGFNGARKHQKIEHPDYYYWADVLGLLVWEEMPSAYRFTHESVERITREWIEVLDRDMNHPSIAIWVPFNESWGVPDLAEKVSHQSCVQAMYHLTRTLDPTRPVIGNDGWESTATDILGIHDYDDNPERILRKYNIKTNIKEALTQNWPGGRMLTLEGYAHNGQPIMLTEFGGIACKDPRVSDFEIWGYSVCRDGEELRGRYERLMESIHKCELFTGFCYTQFTDTFQEANGLFTADRKPKFSLKTMSKATRGAVTQPSELMVEPLSNHTPPPTTLPGEPAGHA